MSEMIAPGSRVKFPEVSWVERRRNPETGEETVEKFTASEGWLKGYDFPASVAHVELGDRSPTGVFAMGLASYKWASILIKDLELVSDVYNDPFRVVPK